MATCKYCGALNLTWKETDEGWRLFNADGSRHPYCKGTKNRKAYWARRKAEEKSAERARKQAEKERRSIPGVLKMLPDGTVIDTDTGDDRPAID